jgi:hypothetical protein
MSDKQLADIICRALIAIVVGIRKKYGLPNYQDIMITIQEKPEDIGLLSNISPLAKVE